MPVDTRFFEPLATPTLGEIADLTGAALIGESSGEITGLASAKTRARPISVSMKGQPRPLVR